MVEVLRFSRERKRNGHAGLALVFLIAEIRYSSWRTASQEEKEGWLMSIAFHVADILVN